MPGIVTDEISQAELDVIRGGAKRVSRVLAQKPQAEKPQAPMPTEIAGLQELVSSLQAQANALSEENRTLKVLVQVLASRGRVKRIVHAREGGLLVSSDVVYE